MKIEFYFKDKKKSQVVKVKSKEDIMTVAKIAKCNLTVNSLLKDLDFSKNSKLMWKIKGKEYNMKELWAYLIKHLDMNNETPKKKDKKSKKKKNKKKSSMKNKKSNNTSKTVITKSGVKVTNGLARIGSRHK